MYGLSLPTARLCASAKACWNLVVNLSKRMAGTSRGFSSLLCVNRACRPRFHAPAAQRVLASPGASGDGRYNPVMNDGSLTPDLAAEIERNAAAALAEDIGAGDWTALLTPEASTAHAAVLSRGAAVLCGQPWF